MLRPHYHVYLTRGYERMINAHQSIRSAVECRTGEDEDGEEFHDEELELLWGTLRLVLRRIGRREEEAREFWASLPRDVIEKCSNGEMPWPDHPGSKVNADV